MPLFGSKKDHHKDDVTDLTAHGSHSSHHSHHSVTHAADALDTNPSSKEFKYERVEKIAVDADGHAELKDVREDRGAEDPGMNFKDKRPPALVPGREQGYVPNVSELDTISTHSNSSSRIRNADAFTGSATGAASALATEKHIVREKTSDYGPSEYSNRSVRSSDLDNASIASSVSSASTMSHRSNRTEARNVDAVRQEAPVLERDVNVLQSQVEKLRESGLGQERQLNPPVPARPVETFHTETHHLSGVSAPRVAEHVVHERTEVIRQSTAPRETVVDYVTVPVQRMEGARLEHVRSGYTYTQDKELVIPGPLVAPPIPSVTHDLLAQGSGGASAEIHAATNVDLLSNVDVNSMAPEEYERYRLRVEDLARQHEAEASAKAAQYRQQVEQDAELIRRTLERQHIRDIEFRKDMIESAVDRQQHEIQLEAEYAMRALEKEREAARQALEAAKMQTNIDVRVDTAIGTTVSKGSVNTTTEREVRETTGAPLPGATRL